MYIPALRILLVFFLMNPSNLIAQTPPLGISVSPSIIKTDLETDGEEFILFYKNTTEDPVQLSFKAQDFTELEEGWKVKFLEGKDAKNYSYSLSSWLEFERQTLELNPNEQRELKVRVKKDSLSPGGHYATVLAEVNQRPDEKGQVTIKGILSSLVFVRASTGNEIEKAEITSFNPASNPLFTFPKKVVLRLNNIGNTELVPYGLLEIKDIFGNTVAKSAINEESLITLPETIRRYDIELKPTGLFILPGLFKANLTIDYGKNQQKLTRQIEFLNLGSLDWRILLLVLVTLGSIPIILKRKRSKSKNKESKTTKV
jgi:hypothetical protein